MASHVGANDVTNDVLKGRMCVKIKSHVGLNAIIPLWTYHHRHGKTFCSVGAKSLDNTSKTAAPLRQFRIFVI